MGWLDVIKVVTTAATVVLDILDDGKKNGSNQR